MGYFSAIYSEDLPHRAKTVYMYLKDRCNQNNQCYPAIGTITKELHLSRRPVERAISDLLQAGLLEKEQRWREGYAIMAYAGKGTPEGIFKSREKNKEPPSEGGSSCSLAVQHGLNGGLNNFLVSAV